MKTQAKLLFVLLAVLFAIACAKNEGQDAFSILPDSKPILEISQDAFGLWDVTGNTLFFRLYSNGSAEFEYPDDKKKTTAKSKNADEINTLKQVKISEREFQKFSDLLNSEDFQKIQNKYKRKCCCNRCDLEL
ncbi:MAG: hypothetical protein H0U87_08855 [Acidobacteria bacterium]|nr:hypothetical protein [Acidobacteriota bacterium]